MGQLSLSISTTIFNIIHEGIPIFGQVIFDFFFDQIGFLTPYKATVESDVEYFEDDFMHLDQYYKTWQKDHKDYED